MKIQGKEFEMTPIPLRTVRPFVMDEILLTEVAEEEGFDVTDQMEVTKYLKLRVRKKRCRDMFFLLSFFSSGGGADR